MKFTINLATRRYLNTRLLNAVLLALLLILGGLSVLNVREAAYNQGELSRLKKEAAAAGKPGGPTVSQAQLDVQAGKIRFANDLIGQKTVNWLGLLDDLESVVPPGVALGVIEPSKREQSVKISGAAHSFNEVRAMLENMEHSKKFSDVFLLSQGDTKVGQTQQGVAFSISCKVSYR